MSEASADILRLPAEVQYADQLEALRQNDKDERPSAWRLSPRSALAYVTGTPEPLRATIQGEDRLVPITRKFFGDDALVARAIVTVASERALLLVGEPGTGKSWLSEHLAAAISGCSTLTLQGTAGTTEDQIKYSWNIARVIAEGARPENLVPSPTMLAMRAGGLLRFEEITRCVPDVQDALVSVLSDKAIAVPELPDGGMIWARPGFNVIATANTRDQGVNDLSAALKRRFNYVYLPVVSDHATEAEIIRVRSRDLLEKYNIPGRIEEPILDLLATVFRELRGGVTREGASVQRPGGSLSTAEAIGVALDSAIAARFFGSGIVGPADVAAHLVGTVVKENRADLDIFRDYLAIVARKRDDPLWRAFVAAASKEVSRS